MINIVFLIGGVCCALLCHWIINRTYLKDGREYVLEEHRYVSTYKKLLFPRWAYILMWLYCTLLAPIAILFPVAVIVYVVSSCCNGDAKFECKNKFVHWLTKKV